MFKWRRLDVRAELVARFGKEYTRWQGSNRLKSGLYWRGDVQDGMEEINQWRAQTAVCASHHQQLYVWQRPCSGSDEPHGRQRRTKARLFDAGPIR